GLHWALESGRVVLKEEGLRLVPEPGLQGGGVSLRLTGSSRYLRAESSAGAGLAVAKYDGTGKMRLEATFEVRVKEGEDEKSAGGSCCLMCWKKPGIYLCAERGQVMARTYTPREAFDIQWTAGGKAEALLWDVEDPTFLKPSRADTTAQLAQRFAPTFSLEPRFELVD
ncbi:unnamed protein product, partial [Effrenium voratum]